MDVSVLLYKTYRRPFGDKYDDEWVPWYNLAYGAEIDDVLSVVCYVNDVDISQTTTLINSDGSISLVKADGHASNKKMDYTFRITFSGNAGSGDSTFKGRWTQHGKTFEWKGEFMLHQKRKRRATTGPVYGPDGKTTLQQLLILSSLSAKGKDIAQKEADRIFSRIVLQSVPGDVKEKLYKDLPDLDEEEKEIQKLAPDFLAHAGVINILSHLQTSTDVPAAQRNRINKTKCDAFFPACAAFEKPADKEDPVETFGWDRTRDKSIIEKVQKQYRDVALKCYRLGYVRSVHAFRPYLKDAKFWYKRLSERLESPAHVKEVTLRAKSKDSRLEADIQDWITKLTLLHEMAGDISDAPTIPDVMGTLQGACTLASLDMLEWNAQFAGRLSEFFKKLDEYDKSPERKNEEYFALQKLLAQCEGATWKDVGAAILDVIKEHEKLLHRKATFSELTTLIAESEAKGVIKGWPKAFDIIKSCISPSLIATGLTFTCQVLFKAVRIPLAGIEDLSVSEQISLYGSLVIGITKSLSVFIPPAQSVILGAKVLARQIGRVFERLIPSRALSFINAAKVFGTNFETAVGIVKGFWKSWSKTIKLCFGFFISAVVLWTSASELRDKLDDGTTAEKWIAGVELVVAALETVVLAVELASTAFGITGAAALAGTLGMVLAGIGVIVGIAALIIILSLREDPVKDFIDEYGPMYGMLE